MGPMGPQKHTPDPDPNPLRGPGPYQDRVRICRLLAREIGCGNMRDQDRFGREGQVCGLLWLVATQGRPHNLPVPEKPPSPPPGGGEGLFLGPGGACQGGGVPDPLWRPVVWSIVAAPPADTSPREPLCTSLVGGAGDAPTQSPRPWREGFGVSRQQAKAEPPNSCANGTRERTAKVTTWRSSSI